ncbi:hypothetical protein [Pararhodobacter oceanensis]|uniref:hypothetical protein n=1 Tax=Pararhodobacter oceanensis TaxID=2172121 RepID=UPI001057FEC4|nr:hypothetical protein [Pararhodobacter oceanensis]
METVGNSFGWLDAAVTWLPILISSGALWVSYLAYTRSAPPTMPNVWAEFGGRGEKGATIKLVVNNRTDLPVRVQGYSVKGYKAAPYPFQRLEPKPGQAWFAQSGFVPPEWLKFVISGSDVLPGKALEERIAVPIIDTKENTTLSICFSISINRRTIKTKKIVFPVIIPPMAEIKNSE